MAKILTCPNYTAAIVVVHGRSEEIIANHIKSSLRLNIHIHKRKTSIQINGLLHELESNFKDLSALGKNPNLFLNVTDKKIQDFKIFTLMDTDDCSEKTKQSYMNGDIFNKYALKEYIVPIYSIPDLEHVLHQSKLIPKVYNDSEKVREYGKLFPVSSVPMGESALPMDNIIQTCKKLEKNTNTNWNVFLDYCIKAAENRRIKK